MILVSGYPVLTAVKNMDMQQQVACSHTEKKNKNKNKNNVFTLVPFGADRRTGERKVTQLPKFLGWINCQIVFAMGLS